MDFLVDSSFKPWLLEVNTNPCLEVSCPVLERLIPRMLENMFRLAVDPIFQPMEEGLSRTLSYYIPDNILENNRFELIFDSMFDRINEWEKHCSELKNEEVYEEEEEGYDDDGPIITEDN